MSKISRRLKQAVALSAMLIYAGNYANVYGHGATSSRVQTSRELLEAANEEIKYLTAKVTALEKLDKQNRELVDALDAQVKAQERTIISLKAAMATGEKITGVDDKLLASLQASVADAKKEIARWQGKAAFWRRAAAMGVMAAVGIGIAIGIAISK